MSPFDFVNAINAGKNIIRKDDNPELLAKQYAPFIVNRAFSYYKDTILIANELNINNSADNIMHFEYLLHSIRPSKRHFVKWAKKVNNDDIEFIQQVYNVNRRRAEEYLKVITPEQLTIIKKRQFKGGRE